MKRILLTIVFTLISSTLFPINFIKSKTNTPIILSVQNKNDKGDWFVFEKPKHLKLESKKKGYLYTYFIFKSSHPLIGKVILRLSKNEQIKETKEYYLKIIDDKSSKKIHKKIDVQKKYLKAAVVSENIPLIEAYWPHLRKIPVEIINWAFENETYSEKMALFILKKINYLKKYILKNKCNYTLLHKAVKKGWEKVANYLIKKGFSIHTKLSCPVTQEINIEKEYIIPYIESTKLKVWLISELKMMGNGYLVEKGEKLSLVKNGIYGINKKNELVNIKNNRRLQVVNKVLDTNYFYEDLKINLGEVIPPEPTHCIMFKGNIAKENFKASHYFYDEKGKKHKIIFHFKRYYKNQYQVEIEIPTAIKGSVLVEKSLPKNYSNNRFIIEFQKNGTFSYIANYTGGNGAVDIIGFLNTTVEFTLYGAKHNIIKLDFDVIEPELILTQKNNEKHNLEISQIYGEKSEILKDFVIEPNGMFKLLYSRGSVSEIPLAITIINQKKPKQIKLKIKKRSNVIEQNILSLLNKKKFKFPKGSSALDIASICKRNKILEMLKKFKR